MHSQVDRQIVISTPAFRNLLVARLTGTDFLPGPLKRVYLTIRVAISRLCLLNLFNHFSRCFVHSTKLPANKR